MVLWVRYPVSLLEAEAASIPDVNQRLTVLPSAVFSTKLASRSCFISLAIRSKASSQEIFFHSVPPGARYSGASKRFGLWMKSIRLAPLGHNVQRLTG